MSERKNPVKDQVPSAVKEMFSRLMDSYPEFSGCGGTVAAFVIQSRKFPWSYSSQWCSKLARGWRKMNKTTFLG